MVVEKDTSILIIIDLFYQIIVDKIMLFYNHFNLPIMKLNKA